MRTGRLLVILCLAAFALTAGQANAAFPGANGEVAGTVCEDGPDCNQWHIWVVNPDGSGLHQLFADPDHLGDDPSYSADGRWIAFQRCVSDGSGHFDCGIAIVDAHGQNLKQLTPIVPFPYPDYPSFSPDGTKILFTRAGDIWVMGADGSNQHALTSGAPDDMEPVFSPDGTKIAFSRDSHLWLMDANGASPTEIPGATVYESSPDFSPDGSRLVFTFCPGGTTCRVETELLNGTGRHDVTPPAPGGDSEPVFSPDGSTLVFERQLTNDAESGFPFFTIAASGAGSPHRLTTASGYKATWGRMPTPTVDSPPTIGGTASVGHILTATPGAANWGGATSFQWLLCDAQGNACSPIAGATASTYKPTNSARGHTLKVRQTQSDAGGSASADSAATGKVAKEPGAKIARKASVSAKGVASIVLRCPATQSGFCKGRLTLTGSITSAAAKKRHRAKKLGSKSFKIEAGKRATVKVKLSKAARAALARSRKLKVKAKAKSKDDAGNVTTTTARITLRPAKKRHRG